MDVNQTCNSLHIKIWKCYLRLLQIKIFYSAGVFSSTSNISGIFFSESSETQIISSNPPQQFQHLCINFQLQLHWFLTGLQPQKLAFLSCVTEIYIYSKQSTPLGKSLQLMRKGTMLSNKQEAVDLFIFCFAPFFHHQEK